MKKACLYVFFLFAYHEVVAQPSPFYGTLLFNLSDENTGKLVTPDDIQSKDIRFFSFQDYNKKGVLAYDTIQKAFSIRVNGFEIKQFAIVSQSDTVYIDFPSVFREKSAYIQAPIPLKGKSYSFFSWTTYDAMYNNCKYNSLAIFYLCSWGTLHKYEMTDENRKAFRKRWRNARLIELQR